MYRPRFDAAAGLVIGILVGMVIELIAERRALRRERYARREASRDPLTQAEHPHTAMEEVTAPLWEV